MLLTEIISYYEIILRLNRGTDKYRPGMMCFAVWHKLENGSHAGKEHLAWVKNFKQYWFTVEPKKPITEEILRIHTVFLP